MKLYFSTKVITWVDSFTPLYLVKNVWGVDGNNSSSNANMSKKTKRNSLVSPSIQRKAFTKTTPNTTSPKVEIFMNCENSITNDDTEVI